MALRPVAAFCAALAAAGVLLAAPILTAPSGERDAAITVEPFAAHANSFGAQPGYAGNLVDGTEVRTCTLCHGDFDLNSGTGAVLITAPTAVLPGQTVPITVTVVNTTPPASGSELRQGFQATVRDNPAPAPSGQSNVVGTMTITDAVNTGRPPGSGAGPVEYVTHTQTGTSQTTWTFDWTAPDAPTTATVYAAGNAANGGDGTLGDYVYTTSATIAVTTVGTEAGPDARGFALAPPVPNPVREVAGLRLTLGTPAEVAVRIVDGRGRTIRTLAPARVEAGTHVVRVSAAGLRPGVYFVIAEASGATQSQPLIVAP